MVDHGILNTLAVWLQNLTAVARDVTARLFLNLMSPTRKSDDTHTWAPDASSNASSYASSYASSNCKQLGIVRARPKPVSSTPNRLALHPLALALQVLVP